MQAPLSFYLPEVLLKFMYQWVRMCYLAISSSTLFLPSVANFPHVSGSFLIKLAYHVNEIASINVCTVTPYSPAERDSSWVSSPKYQWPAENFLLPFPITLSFRVSKPLFFVCQIHCFSNAYLNQPNGPIIPSCSNIADILLYQWINYQLHWLLLINSSCIWTFSWTLL